MGAAVRVGRWGVGGGNVDALFLPQRLEAIVVDESHFLVAVGRKAGTGEEKVTVYQP